MSLEGTVRMAAAMTTAITVEIENGVGIFRGIRFFF